jgi:hypothetical protein
VKSAAASKACAGTAGLRTRWHYAGAAMLVPFLLLHLGNHLLAPVSLEAHGEVMAQLRHIYRHPVVETLLLLAAGMQTLTGLERLISGWHARVGAVAWLQAATGGVLAVFLPLHVLAVLVGRHVFGLDTTIDFAAAGMHVPPLGALFASYYGLAVAALFTHLACAAWWRAAPRHPRGAAMLLAASALAGSTLGVLVVAAMAGAFENYVPPADYLDPFRRLGLAA